MQPGFVGGGVGPGAATGSPAFPQISIDMAAFMCESQQTNTAKLNGNLMVHPI